MVSSVQQNSPTGYAAQTPPPELNDSVPGEFSVDEDGNVAFKLAEDQNDVPIESLADSIRKSANELLDSNRPLGTLLIDIFASDFNLLQMDLKFIDAVTKNGAPLYQELENLEAILLSAPTSGEMDALVNFNGGQHSQVALNYLKEFINFSIDSGVSNENLNSDIYQKAKSAINKISDGTAPSKEEAAALRAIVSAAKVPMEPYSYANLSSLLQSSNQDIEQIQNNFSMVNR